MEELNKTEKPFSLQDYEKEVTKLVKFSPIKQQPKQKPEQKPKKLPKQLPK